jgi:hypothetical protein
LVGISFGAFLVVACAAPTRVFVTQTLEQAFTGTPRGSVAQQEAREKSFVISHQADSDVQVARLMILWRGPSSSAAFPGGPQSVSEGEIFAQGDKLIQEFPTSPAVYANVLRAECDRIRTIEWRAQEIRSIEGNNKVDFPLPDASTLKDINDFISQGKTAERLDPHNAYFPMMVAVGYYAAHEDDQAQAALLAGANDTDWREYLSVDVTGERKIFAGESEFSDEPDGLDSVGIECYILLPEYSDIRSAARMAVWNAGQLEASGDTDKGIRLRSALVHYGSLMRYYGRIVITNLVGIAVSNVAIDRPAGVNNLSFDNNLPEDRRYPDLIERRLAAYKSFVLSHGQAPQASYAAQELAVGQNFGHSYTMQADNISEIRTLKADVILEIIGILEIGWVLLIGCLSAVLITAIGLFRSVRAKKFNGGAAAKAAVFVLSALLLALVSMNIVHLDTVLRTPGIYDQTTFQYIPTEAAVVVFSPFALFIVMAMLVALVRRKKVTRSLVSSSLTAAVPCMCLLLLLFTGSTLWRARVDGKIQHESIMRRSIGEGQYVFQKAHIAWPALVTEPVQR